MSIGTPLSDSATRVMLLGAGELGKEVIIALQRLGVEVIAVDRYANAPGHQVAHQAHHINMLDADKLLELIEQERPDYIVPEIEAIATNVLAEVERRGLATVIPTALATQLTMNRKGIRKLAAETLELPTSAYAFAESHEELLIASERVGFPCIIKPIMSSSGKGQSGAETLEELAQCWAYAQSAGRGKFEGVIIEKKVDFDYEITLLTVRSKNADGEIITSFCDPIGHRQEKGDYVESWQPQAMTHECLTKAREIAEKVTSSLGGLGLFGVELFISGDEVLFSEVSPRPHDTGMVTMASQHQNEFELHARAILGLPVNTQRHSMAASAVIYAGFKGDTIRYDGLEQALAIDNTDLRLFGKPDCTERRRMGVALAFGDDTEDCRRRAKMAASQVKPGGCPRIGFLGESKAAT